MAGIWPHSLLQQHDAEGVPLAGAKAYFFEAGTSTPLDTFSDYGLTSEHTHPVEADGLGRFPAVYLDDGTYRCRLTDVDGVQIFDVDGIPVVGASGGGGGGGTVFDEDGLLDTGDLIFSTKTGARSGFVRANGRTIGSATSGATERANADTQPLYEHLWGAMSDTLAPVAGGRGASAAADFAANKALTLPDAKNRAIFGTGSMGGSASGRITASKVLGSSADAVGASGGTQDKTLVADNIPAHTHTFSATTGSGGNHDHGGATGSGGAHSHDIDLYMRDVESGAGEDAYSDGGYEAATLTTDTEAAHTHTIAASGTHTHTVSGTTGSTGIATAADIMPPFMFATVYIRL
jgi:microcystin-dependent protein